MGLSMNKRVPTHMVTTLLGHLMALGYESGAVSLDAVLQAGVDLARNEGKDGQQYRNEILGCRDGIIAARMRRLKEAINAGK